MFAPGSSMRARAARVVTCTYHRSPWHFVAAFAAQVRALFPGCPSHEATRIAVHACRRYNGRVGRTAAARALDPGGDRQLAREEVRAQVDTVLSEWQQPARSGKQPHSVARA